MRIAYVDPFAGASGDMLLGALVDAGWSVDRLRRLVEQLDLPGVVVSADAVLRRGIRAIHVRIHTDESARPGDGHPRGMRELLNVIEGAGFPPASKARIVAIVRRLAEVEARIHGTSVDSVHFHEVGAVDTLVDIAGVVTGLAELGVERLAAGALPVGHGAVRTAHGVLPVPPPAVAGLTIGLPTRGVAVEGELVTPTGAALLAELADEWGPQPAMTVESVGYGAGSRDFPIANVLRLFVGVAAAAGPDTLVTLETNVDDMNPEWFEFVSARLFAAGALDVWTTPIGMKKGRPATLLSALCSPELADGLTDLLFRETTTFGVRRHEVRRERLDRRFADVPTPFGSVRVKLGYRRGRLVQASPEYESCRAAAEASGAPLKDVFSAASRAADDMLASE